MVHILYCNLYYADMCLFKSYLYSFVNHRLHQTRKLEASQYSSTVTQTNRQMNRLLKENYSAMTVTVTRFKYQMLLLMTLNFRLLIVFRSIYPHNPTHACIRAQVCSLFKLYRFCFHGLVYTLG